jgi:hypothetical protein
LGRIKHALIIGEELAEVFADHLDGESEATKSMALQWAVRFILSADERMELGKGIMDDANWECVENLEQEVRALPQHIQDALGAFSKDVEDAHNVEREGEDG